MDKYSSGPANLSRKATQATWWSALEIAARFGTQIVVTIILARLLSPADFGLIAMILVFTSIGLVLTDAGFGSALVQRRSVSPDDETTVFVFSFLTGFFAAGLMWATAEPIAEFYHQPSLIKLIEVISFVFIFGALGVVPDALLTRQLRFADRAKVQLTASLVSGIVAITMALYGFGPLSLVLQVLIMTGLRAGLLWWVARLRLRGRFTWASFRSLFSFGGFMLLSGLLNIVSIRLQSLVIGRLFSVEALGYYALAQNVTQAPTNFVGGVLSRVGLPVFSTLTDDKIRLREALKTSLQISMFLFIPVMLGISLAASPMIDIIYGSRWQPAAGILSLLAIAGALWPIHVLNLTVLNALGYSDKFFRLEIFKNVLVISATLIAAPFGVMAIAGSMLATACLSTVINSWYSQRMLGYGLWAQLCDQRHTFWISTLAAISAWAILHFLNPGIWQALGAITSAAIIYIGLAVWCSHPALFKLISMFRNSNLSTESAK